MKKKALIIGNLDPNLGVEKDIETFSSFLKCKEGGCWNDNEIEILRNPSKLQLESIIQEYKKENLDYLLLLFGGHGDSVDGTTYLHPSYVNGYNISEDIFNNIAPKQLSIFDCCRARRENILDDRKLFESASIEDFSLQLLPEEIRELYHNQISSAVSQHLKLYSCELHELAQDDDGGLYTQNFISDALRFTHEKTERFFSAISIHQKCKIKVEALSGRKQHPTYKGLWLKGQN